MLAGRECRIVVRCQMVVARFVKAPPCYLAFFSWGGGNTNKCGKRPPVEKHNLRQRACSPRPKVQLKHVSNLMILAMDKDRSLVWYKDRFHLPHPSRLEHNKHGRQAEKHSS